MKLTNLKTLAAVFFTVAAVFATGCAAGDVEEPTTDQKPADGEELPKVETSEVSPKTCPTPAMCAKAFANCANPRLGGTWCYIANNCRAGCL